MLLDRSAHITPAPPATVRIAAACTSVLLTAGKSLSGWLVVAHSHAHPGASTGTPAPTFTQSWVDVFIKQPKALDALAGQQEYVVDGLPLPHVAPVM